MAAEPNVIIVLDHSAAVQLCGGDTPQAGWRGYPAPSGADHCAYTSVGRHGLQGDRARSCRAGGGTELSH